ncbi:MAG: twin-arginine translocase subunit TatC [Clostridiales bacterium]
MIESKNILIILSWLEKYRKKLIIVLMIPVISTMIVYFFSEKILDYILILLNNNKLYFLTPIEAVMAKLKLSFFIGLIVSYPILCLLIISMFSNFIHKKNKLRLYLLVVPVSTIFLYAGIIFGFKFILPTTIDFLLNSGVGLMEPTISANSYISFIGLFVIIIGIVFEIPIVLLTLSKMGIVKYKMLKGKRRVTILSSVIIMAILTPTPDAFTLIGVTIPVILLFEISLWGVYILEKLKKRKENNEKSK